jgi:glyoxylate/hydroxypyruvate reductase A
VALLLTPLDEPVDAWVAAFDRELPDLQLRCWPDIGNRGVIELAVIGTLPHGELARLPCLRLIASIFAGQDLLLSDPMLPAGVPIVRTGDPEGDPMMTEFVLLHVLRHHRNMPAYARAQTARHWGRLPQARACERRVGIMGLGPIGLGAALTVKAAGFDVAGWTRRPRNIPNIATFHGADQLERFLKRTDILVNLLPLTRETENVLDHRALSCLPRGASVINLGRGQHVVDEDLLDLVDAKHIAAATLDAFRTEPLPVEHPFWTHPAITITPHAARRLDVDGIARRVALQWHRLNADQPLEGLVDRAAGY